MERGRKSKVEAAGIEPAGLSPQSIAGEQVADSDDPLVSTFVAPIGRVVTLINTDWPNLVSILAAWPRLDPKTRQAIAELMRTSLSVSRTGATTICVKCRSYFGQTHLDVSQS